MHLIGYNASTGISSSILYPGSLLRNREEFVAWRNNVMNFTWEIPIVANRVFLAAEILAGFYYHLLLKHLPSL